MKTLRIALTVLLFSTGAAHAETLKGFLVNGEGLTFQVESGGCTSKDDFELRQLETFPVQLELVRVNPDFCEAYLPYGTSLTYSWDELGMQDGSEFILRNELQSSYRVFRFQ